MFEPTSPKFFANQSLEGILQRAIAGPWRVVWIIAVAAVVFYGLRAAVLTQAVVTAAAEQSWVEVPA